MRLVSLWVNRFMVYHLYSIAEIRGLSFGLRSDAQDSGLLFRGEGAAGAEGAGAATAAGAEVCTTV